MTPYEKAMRVYEEEECSRTFSEDLELHLRYGFVVSNPNVFAMGYPVMRDERYEDLVTPHKARYRADCWWIYLASGRLYDLMLLLPYSLPWIGYERNNRPRFFELEKFRCKVLQTTLIYD